MWSIDSLDTSGEVGSSYVAQTVMDAARPGSIVLLHENQPETPRALERILAGLRRKRLRPVTLPELLTLDAPRARQLRRGPKGCPRPDGGARREARRGPLGRPERAA